MDPSQSGPDGTAVRFIVAVSLVLLVAASSSPRAADIHLPNVRSDPERFVGLRVVIRGRIDHRSGAAVKFLDRTGDGVTIDLGEGRTRIRRDALERIFRLPEGKINPPLAASLTVRVVEGRAGPYELEYEELTLR